MELNYKMEFCESRREIKVRKSKSEKKRSEGPMQEDFFCSAGAL